MVRVVMYDLGLTLIDASNQPFPHVKDALTAIQKLVTSGSKPLLTCLVSDFTMPTLPPTAAKIKAIFDDYLEILDATGLRPLFEPVPEADHTVYARRRAQTGQENIRDGAQASGEQGQAERVPVYHRESRPHQGGAQRIEHADAALPHSWCDQVRLRGLVAGSAADRASLAAARRSQHRGRSESASDRGARARS